MECMLACCEPMPMNYISIFKCCPPEAKALITKSQCLRWWMIDRNGAKKALTRASKTAHCCSHAHPSTPPQTHCCQQTHPNTHRGKRRSHSKWGKEALCRETIITNAEKDSGAKGQTACDKRTINRTETPERMGGEWVGYGREHFRFSRGKQAWQYCRSSFYFYTSHE